MLRALHMYSHDPAVIAHLASNRPRYISAFVKIEWPTDNVLTHSGVGPIDLFGETYTGVGALVSISAVQDADVGSRDTVEIGVKNIPSAEISEVQNNDAIGSKVRIWTAYNTPAGKVIGVPKSFYFGYLDGRKLIFNRNEHDGTKLNIILTASSGENPRLVKSSILSLQTADPSDTLFRHLQDQTKEGQNWPG